MSSWQIITLRGRKAQDYERTRSDSHDRWDATADIVATAAADSTVRKWTVWSSHVYLYTTTSDWERAEQLIESYQDMVDDAVVLRANDTTDVGTARYYPVQDPTGGYTDEYRETQSHDGLVVGQLALATINSRHNIVARDPWHNQAGRLDDEYLSDGEDQLQDKSERRFEA